MNGDIIATTRELGRFEQWETDISLSTVDGAKLVVLNELPVQEPIVAHRPFAMNTLEEISQAVLDYPNGEMGLLTQVQDTIAPTIP